MGLSSKQVSGDGLDWGRNFLQAGALVLPKSPQVRQQQQQQQQEQQQLRCPRCDSINTKFCYYNNYNRSQPRHFCKSCKRHWTKGGTLRNVPVGGGRKNKRHKTPNNATAAAASTTTTTATNSHEGNNSNIAIQLHQQQQQLPLASLLPLSMQPNYINNENSSNNKFNRENNNILGSSISLPPISNFPFTNLTSLNNNSSFLSSTFQFPNVYNYTGDTEAIDNLTVTSIATTIETPPWQMPTTSSFMDSSSHWSWEDLTAFISTDLKQKQDESQ